MDIRRSNGNVRDSKHKAVTWLLMLLHTHVKINEILVEENEDSTNMIDDYYEDYDDDILCATHTTCDECRV